MGDRPLVRTRPLNPPAYPPRGSARAWLLLLLPLPLLLSPTVHADEPAAVPIERRPYAIRALLAVEPAARIDPKGQQALVRAWQGLVQRFVGAPWNLEIVAAEGRLAAVPPAEFGSEDFKPVAASQDILWAIRLSPGERGGYRLSGRAYDTLTATLGPVVGRDAPFPSDLPRSLLGLALDLFQPIAEVGPSSAGGVALTVQAGALAPADPAGQLFQAGSIFVPIRLVYQPDGTLARIVPIGWSYLKVETHEGPVARCSILSSLRDPLSRRVLGRSRLVALGIKPAAQPLRFRFETRTPHPQPAAGFTLTVRDAPDGPPRVVGTTDRAGRIVLPARAAHGLVILRLLAGGVEPLVEFPAMPGETTEERLIKVDTLNQAVALETRLNALRDEVVDLVAIRARIEARLKARAEGNAWDEVRPLLDEYQRLPGRQTYVDRLETLKAEAARQQEQLKVPVLTRTAQALVDDTEALILRYLDDELFEAYARAYGEAQGLGLAAPSPEWKPFVPAGSGLRVLMPGTPVLRTPAAGTEAASGEARLYASTYQGATYAVGYGDEPRAAGSLPAAVNARAALERKRDATLKTPGTILLDQKNLTLNGVPGLELRIELPGRATDSEPTIQRARMFVTPAGRFFLASYTGPKSTVEGREAEAFFHSFHIDAHTARPAAPVPAPAPAHTAAPKAEAAPAPPAAPTPARPKALPPGSTPF